MGIVRGTLHQFHQRLLAWYTGHRRDLPWRVSPGAPEGSRPDPYQVLVSEAMLQQTQVATVIPYYRRFMARFPTLWHLASADEQEVLQLWQGLGYYSRARLLRGTAKLLLEKYRGQVPAQVEELLSLPGIGRYTAGAIASLAFDQRAAILDGNVMRVLCRLEGIADDPRQGQTNRRLWELAEKILPQERVGDFNSALMELGATLCTARAPKCLLCPVREHCQALAAGVQEQIPPPRVAKNRPLERRWVLCIARGSEWLIEQRPARGRWASLWQFPAVACAGDAPTSRLIRSCVGLSVRSVRRLGEVRHELTHRRYEFEVFVGRAGRGKALESGAPRPQRWVELSGLSDYPLPRPHQRIAALLAGCSS